jgi:hypothetical protein
VGKRYTANGRGPVKNTSVSHIGSTSPNDGARKASRDYSPSAGSPPPGKGGSGPGADRSVVYPGDRITGDFKPSGNGNAPTGKGGAGDSAAKSVCYETVEGRNTQRGKGLKDVDMAPPQPSAESNAQGANMVTGDKGSSGPKRNTSSYGY